MFNKISYSIILTSYKEPISIKKAIYQILSNPKDIIDKSEILLTSPDEDTIKAAIEAFSHSHFTNYKIVKDKLLGKPAALNLAQKEAKGEILILTDGDMYIDKSAIGFIISHFKDTTIGGVSGRPLSTDSKLNMFGFFSHLFCEAAHQKRLTKDFIPMSGYLYAIRNLNKLFPIPEELRAEDGYISHKLIELNYKIVYEPNAKAYVSFPKNTKDWLIQKVRSLGGNYQLNKYIRHNLNSPSTRSISQDLKEIILPFRIASTPKEYLYLFYLYPLRLTLWIIIIYKYLSNTFSKGAWERPESSKSN